MNILMLGWELPPHNSGGLGVACYHMSKALALEGATIDFVVPYQARHETIDYMKIHHATKLSPLDRYGLNAYDHSSVEGISQSPHLRTMREVQREYTQYVEKMLETATPDVIHAHDWLTMEAGVRAKEITNKPLVVHVHATEYDRSGGVYGNPVVHEIEQHGLLLADRIIAVSEITKSIIVDKYNIPADKVEVVHNAFDPASMEDYEYDHKTYAYLEALKREGYTVVSVVTRLTLQKGLSQLLRAAARAIEKNDKLAFLIAGDGDQRDELIETSANLRISDKVFFTGFVRGREWRDAYSVSDVFVMSSISEPFGLAALEAAHHGNALIISKQSGVGEVLNNIFRYDYWDIDKLADQLVGIASSASLASALSEGVKQEYCKLSWSDVAKRCLSVFESKSGNLL
ncbi:MAG: glycosyltransferase family 4 protein [bacterium]|nr:glycosyltransferase family 4 protein [bacterium]MDN5835331.1 glycosyltransferase family 4 protein [bacterium]